MTTFKIACCTVLIPVGCAFGIYVKKIICAVFSLLYSYYISNDIIYLMISRITVKEIVFFNKNTIFFTVIRVCLVA